MKSGLVNSCSALATALLAMSIVFGASRAPAEDLDATSCLPPIVIAENSADVAEALEVSCLSARADAQTFDTVEVASPSDEGQGISVEVTRSETVAAPGNDIRLWFADASFLSAIEGQAILIEVAQSVTVAASGNDVADGATDIAGSAPSIAILDRIE
jgi:hypothetical protein